MFKVVVMWTVTSCISVVTSVLGKSVIADLRVENVNGGEYFSNTFDSRLRNYTNS